MVRTSSQESEREQLFYGIGVDSRRTKSERKTKYHLEKNC